MVIFQDTGRDRRKLRRGRRTDSAFVIGVIADNAKAVPHSQHPSQSAKPGLHRQHLTAVRAAARIGRAEVDGASLNSTELTFRPARTEAGEYTFDIGSAGSTTLVFQTVLPALLLTDGPSVLRFVGGTHNHGSPPWDFLDQVFLPAVRRMGAKVTATLGRHGFALGAAASRQLAFSHRDCMESKSIGEGRCNAGASGRLSRTCPSR